MPELIDRLEHARELSRNRRVLDVGGLGMVYGGESAKRMHPLKWLHRKAQELSRGARVPASESDFARALASGREAAKEHRVVDFQDHPDVDYRIDMNQRECVQQLQQAINEFRPEVILCMETLEHVNYRHEVMNEFARAVSEYGSTVFVTVPNNANWILNSLGWNFDHSVAFFRDIAERFVHRSDLGKHQVVMNGCMQKYAWYWPVVYLLSFCQPFNWGFTIRPRQG